MTKEHKDLYEEYKQEEILRGHTEQGFESTVRGARKVITYAESISCKVWEIGIRAAQGFQGWLIETGRNDGKPYKVSLHSASMSASLSCYYSFFLL